MDETASVADTRAALDALRRAGRRIAFVPTMGALHAGHLALVARARELADVVVVSVFVNPLQFGPGEDLARYPRDVAGDRGKLAAAGVDLLLLPTAAELYPGGTPDVRVTAGPVGALLEGAVRPGHFDGVLTVVLKLLHVVQPDVVVLGQKDAQQAFLVRRMVADLDVPVAVEVVATVREPDGLALSSRNRYLDEDERVLALAVPAVLDAVARSAADGLEAAIAAGTGALPPEVVLDYLALVDPASFQPVDARYRGGALALVAARVGATRLIDNRTVRLG